MRILSCKIYQYQLPLTQPLVIHNQKINERQGILIQLISDGPREGWGEISPLPPLNQEHLDEVAFQAKQLRPYLEKQTLPDGLERFNGKFQNWLGEMKL